jgi:hypothetical protein
MTMTVPKASASGMLRRGSFHFAGGERDVVPGISREERPTWATQSAINMP